KCLRKLPCNTVLFHYFLYFRRGQHTVSWSSAQTPSTQITVSTPARIWRQVQKVLRLASRQQPRPPNITLKFILGPAALTVTARLLGTGAHCEADVNNNVPLEVQGKEKIPEFSLAVPWEFVRPQLFALIGAIILAFGAAAVNIQIPLMLGDLVNVVTRHMREQAGHYMRDIKAPAMKLLGLCGLQGLLTSGYIILLSRVGERVAADMRTTLFTSLLRFVHVAFFDANKTGQLVNRLTSDIQEFKSSFKLVISQGLRSATQTVGCFGSLHIISPKLTGLTVVVLPCLVGAGALIGSFLGKLSRKAQEQVAKATGVADEALGNARTVRAFAMEDRELEYDDRLLSTFSVLMLREKSAEFCGIVENQRLLGFKRLSDIQAYWGEPWSRCRRCEYFHPFSNIQILHLFPLYSGKSTVAALLERFYDPSSGEVMLDGLDIRTLDPSWLRGHVIGFISQEPVLFGTSVMENIRFGKPSDTDAEVMAAAKQANAHNFITGFPDGYNTVVGDGAPGFRSIRTAFAHLFNDVIAFVERNAAVALIISH
uniref:ATP-binding cassette, sub-family B (MDR/TAP), member 8 n=1 Tax=Sinocyclocheilus grahami TaxID=75366 RepID=A0A672LNP1_SINGR